LAPLFGGKKPPAETGKKCCTMHELDTWQVTHEYKEYELTSPNYFFSGPLYIIVVA
jgi:hypothetical protein